LKRGVEVLPGTAAEQFEQIRVWLEKDFDVGFIDNVKI